MSEISLKLFHDSELLPVLLACMIFSVFIVLLFHFIPHHKKSDETHYTHADWRNLILITGIYAIVSFWQLGSFTMPVTTWQPTTDTGVQDIIFRLDKDTAFDAVYTFYGEGDNNSNPDTYQLGTESMQIYGSDDNKDWHEITTLEKGSIYEYTITEGSWNYRYIWLRCNSRDSSLSEIAFRSKDHTHFLPVSVYMDASENSDYPASLLIDEQNKVSMYPTYMNEAYFDEIYHPRNAWEIANGEDMYATVHPLLGTNLIALSIHILGNSPLAWRLPGWLFGVMLIPMFYAITKKLFHKTDLCTIGAVLLAGDFMHLTTSRIATLEPFSVFFILLMFYFMISYIQTSFFKTDFAKQIRLLAFCGISMGLAIATKWTGCYSAVGLAILLFAYWIKSWHEYKQLKKTDVPELKKRIKDFPLHFWITFCLCFVFFILIPVLIYCFSYLPDKVWKGDTWSFANVWKQAEYMYNYHINLNATHPYSSTWNQWIFDIRPIWYYFGTGANGLYHSISCFSNPLMTWAALPSIIYVLIETFRKKDQSAWVILIGYITALAPWMIIKRCVFAYHFYPTSFFAILAIVYACRALLKIGKSGKVIIMIYLVLYVYLFFAFLPVTAGFGTTLDTIHSLEWFSTWYFG